MDKPVISRGQLWRNIYGLNHVTVRDFAEYTSGWMVAVTPGVPHDPDEDRSLISEDEFRKNWKLING